MLAAARIATETRAQKNQHSEQSRFHVPLVFLFETIDQIGWNKQVTRPEDLRGWSENERSPVGFITKVGASFAGELSPAPATLASCLAARSTAARDSSLGP